jgi:hypothetical protein
MQLYRGIIPLLYTKEREEEWMNDIDARVQFAVEFGKKSRFLRHLFNFAFLAPVSVRFRNKLGPTFFP